MTGNSWGYLVLLYVFVQLSRVVVVGLLYPFLRYFGYGLDWKEATILVWSGLRGAVALSLSLSVKASCIVYIYLHRQSEFSFEYNCYYIIKLFGYKMFFLMADMAHFFTVSCCMLELGCFLT